MICASTVKMHSGMGAVFLNIYERGVKGGCLVNTLGDLTTALHT